MGTNTTMTATLKIIADVTSAQSSVNKLAQAFSKVKLSDSLKTEMKSAFSSFDKLVEEFKAKLQEPVETKGQASSLTKSATEIKKQYDTIIKQVKSAEKELSASGVDLTKVFKIDDTIQQQIKKLDEQIKTLKQNFTDLGQGKTFANATTSDFEAMKAKVGEAAAKVVTLEQAFDSLGKKEQTVGKAKFTINTDDAKNNLKTIEELLNSISTNSNKKTRNEIIEALTGGDLETAVTKLEELRSNYERFSNSQGENSTWQANVTKVQAALEVVRSLYDAVTQSASNLENQKMEATRAGVEAVAEGLNNAKASAETARPAVQNLSTSTREMAQSQLEYNSSLDQMKSRISYFFSINNAVQLLQRTLRSAFNTVKELDAAMTETAVVTDFTVGDMWNQLPTYTQAANELGTTTLGAYETMTLFYQQGLDTNEVFEIGTETMKMARIAGLDYADATDKMTAALRGFNMELNDTSAQRVNDVYSELAAITAADTEEIATAMTKTASIASSANMEFETTSAFLSQIIETTRESAETAGTAMKTIVARFQELKKDPSEIEEVDGEVVDANKIETALRSVGVALRDTEGQFRDLDDVFLDLASIWDTLDVNTQRYVATMAAGSRQQSRFIAMMQDYDRTLELVDAAYNSSGSSQRQFEKTVDSLESKLNNLKNAWDEFAMGLANSSLIKGVVDILTSLLQTLNKLTSTGNGFTSMLLKMGAAFGTLKVGKTIFNGLLGGLKSDSGLFSGMASSFAKSFQKEFGGIGNLIKKIFSSTKVDFGDIGTIKSQISALKNSMSSYSAAAANTKKATQAVATAEREYQVATQAATAASETAKTSLVNKAALSAQAGTAAKQQAEANVALGEAEAQAAVAAELEANAERDLLGALTALGLKETEINAIEAAGTSDDALAVILSDQKAAAKLKEALATGVYTKELGEELVLEALSNQYKSKGIFNTLKLNAAMLKSGSLQKAYNANVAAGMAQQEAFSKAVSSTVATLGLYALAALAVAGAIVGIVVAVKKAKANSLEGQLKSAQEVTEGATEAAYAARDAYDELLNAQGSYNSTQEALEELTQGTNEFKQALIEANQEVIELLGTYSGLQVAKGDLGQLVITDESWDKVIAEQWQTVQNANSGQLLAQLNEAQKQYNLATSFEGLYGDTPLYMGTVIQDTEDIDGHPTMDFKWYDSSTNKELANLINEGKSDEELLEYLGLSSEDGYSISTQFRSRVENGALIAEALEQAAITEYEQARASYTQALVEASMDWDDYNFSDDIKEEITDVMTGSGLFGDDISKTIADKISGDYSDYSEQLQDAIVDATGSKKNLSEVVNKKNLKEIYADLMNISVDEIPDEIAETKARLREAIAEIELGNAITEQFEELFDDLSSLSPRSQKILTHLFAKNTDAFSEGYETFQKALDEADFENNYQKWAEALGIEAESANDLIEQVITQILEKAEQINSQIAQKLVLGNWYVNATDEQRDKYFDTVAGWSQSEKQEALSTGENIYSSLGWEAEAVYWEAIVSGSQEAKKSVMDFISNVDLSNPIDMAAQFEEAINEGSEAVQALATSFQEMGSTSIDAAHQMSYFLKSADFSDLEDSLEDFIKDNKRITGKNVEELADSNETLNQLLKNNIISVDGMALALTNLSTGEWTISSLSNVVLTSLKNWINFEDQIERTLSLLEEFDPGYSEHTAIETVEEINETITENLERGTINDSAMKTAIEFLFGDSAFASVNDYTGVDRDNELQHLLAQYSQVLQGLVDSGDFYSLWQTPLSGETARGEDIGLTGNNQVDENGIFHARSETGEDEYSIQQLDDGTIELLTDLDSGTFAQKLAEDLDISETMANAMVADMRATTSTVDEMFNKNNLSTAINGLLSELERNEEGKYVLSQQDLETLSSQYGYKGDTTGFLNVLQENYGAEVESYNVFDDYGNLKQGEEFFEEYNKSQGIAAEAVDNTTSALDSFVDSLREDSTFLRQTTDFDGTKKYVANMFEEGESINYDTMVSSMEEATGQARENLQSQLTEAIQAAYASGVDYLTTSYKGQEYQIPIDESTTAAEVEEIIETGIAQADTTLETNQLVNAIQTALTDIDALKITADFPTPEEGITEVSSVITACQNYCDENSLSEDIKINVNQTSLSAALAQIKGKLNSIVANVNVNAGGSSSSSSSSSGRVSGYAQAEGTQNAKATGVALGGELGPELHVSNGRATVIGANGPELFHLSKGDIVYTAEETKKILSDGAKSGLSFSANAIGYGNHSTSDFYWYKKTYASTASTGSTSGTTSATSAVADAEEAAEIWENTFDWLYNLTEDINELLRDREKLERQYDKILSARNTTAKELWDNVQDQLAVLETQRQREQEMYDKRVWEMKDYISKNSDLQDYAWYNWDDMTIEIDWDKIDAVTDEDMGEAIEDYVSKLEDIQDEMDDAEDELMDIEDRIQELIDQGKDEYLDFETMVFEALQEQKQALIDNASEISEAIADTNSALLDSLSDAVSQMRDDRELENDRTDLEDQQKKLIYLQQDTSGGNALEILKLQQDIEDAQQSYTDKLIDRKIDELQQQNDEASEQRERQIELAQEQLDQWSTSQEKWNEIHALMGDGINSVGQIIDGSELMKVIQDKEGVESLSSYGQMDWLKTLESDVKAGLTWFAQDQQLEKIGKTSGTITFTDSSGTEHTGTVNSDGSVTVRDDKNGGNWTYSQVFKNFDGTYRTFEENASFKKDPEPVAPTTTTTTVSSGQDITNSVIKGVAAAILNGGYNWSVNPTRKARLTEVFGSGAAYDIQAYLNRNYKSLTYKDAIGYGYNTMKAKKWNKYKTGGIADYTGPAWLDGTPSKPEIVLNAQDTKNFIELKNVLASLFTDLHGAGSSTDSMSNGDNYYDIDINVESMSSDYDVEQVADKIRGLIVQDGMYRNVNSVNRLK